MIQNLSTHTHVARKIFRDDIYYQVQEWASSGFWSYDCKSQATTEEQTLTVQYLCRHSKPWLILPGERYECQFNVDGGDKWTFRMIAEISAIVHKYNIGNDD